MSRSLANFITPGRKVSARQRAAAARIDLFILCDQIYRLRRQGVYYFSPVRDDGQNAAFAIREDGKVAIDHGTGQGFNAITLVQAVEGLNPVEARQRLAFYAENLVGEPITPTLTSSVSPCCQRQVTAELRHHDWPFLEIGCYKDYAEFARLRGLSVPALIVATALDLFFVYQNKNTGQRLCTITDKARYVRQDRCITGDGVILSSGDQTKSRTVGKASWPVGAANIGNRPIVLLVEGLPDLLAAVQIIDDLGRHRDIAAVTMLGAGQQIHPEALPLFAGKRVFIVPDEDDAGITAAQQWCQQLQKAGATSVILRLKDLIKPGSKSVKDLNEFLIHGGDSVSVGSRIPLK